MISAKCDDNVISIVISEIIFANKLLITFIPIAIISEVTFIKTWFDQTRIFNTAIIERGDPLQNLSPVCTLLFCAEIFYNCTYLFTCAQYSKVPDRMLYSYMTCTVCIYSAITAGHVIILPPWVHKQLGRPRQRCLFAASQTRRVAYSILWQRVMSVYNTTRAVERTWRTRKGT